MREIKFRGWDKKNRIMGYPLFKSHQPDSWYYFDDYGTQEFIDDEFVMQFIGLLDKNGKEIYESDILGLNDPEDTSKCVVIFENGCFKRSYLPFLTKEQLEDDDFFEKEYKHCFDETDKVLWEVIGNIYETPLNS